MYKQIKQIGELSVTANKLKQKAKKGGEGKKQQVSEKLLLEWPLGTVSSPSR